MKLSKIKLSKQLLIIIAIAFALLFTSLGVILPKVLIPVAEANLYNYLSEPLKYMDGEFDKKLDNTEVAYLYVLDKYNMLASDNLNDIIKIKDPKDLLNKITDVYGKFDYNHRTYYYYTITNDNIIKIAISNDNYINRTKANILGTIFPIVLITFLIIGLILGIWSLIIVLKIEKLKLKIDNIDNLDFDHSIEMESDDELKSLALAIEDMRVSLINQEKYRSQMYQNISHDFKTPLTVIKSYIEAVEDEVEDERTALQVIKQQTTKLEQKVHSLLYLNKLDYLKDSKINKNEQVDMVSIINSEVEKFKFHNKEIDFVTDIDKKSKYYGTNEHWETIFDNLLGNFMRYAKKTIKITAKQNKLILYNDGENIDKNLLEGIFTPFRKGIKGEFGLGLSIVKKTLNIMDYDIIIRNEKKGVSFIIFKENRK
ncbi:MAG: HAMP domain-containing histidine kinase [Bacilli bacterium]|nr:HAMP domain-containing histidine kinase [Bacilli bacterium]